MMYRFVMACFATALIVATLAGPMDINHATRLFIELVAIFVGWNAGRESKT